MRAKFHEKISYGASAMVYELEAVTVLSYMVLFCTDVLYLTPAVAGALMFWPKILDAITDIFITNIADRTKTRLGKYRPWLLSGIPLAIMMVLFFWNPSFLTTSTQRLIWVCVVYIIMVPLFETAYMCPMVVMGTVMSEDSGDRLDFAAARSVGENAGDFIVNGLCMTIVLAFGSYQDIAGWRYMAISFAVIMIVCTVIGVVGTKERVVIENRDLEGNPLTLRQKFGLIKGDRPYLRVLIIELGFLISWTVNITLFPYFCISVIGRSEWISSLSLIGVIAQLAGTLSVTYFGRRFDKRTIIFVGGAFMTASSICLCFADGFFGTALYQVLKGLGVGLVYVCTWAYLPEISDYIEWKTKIAAPGIILAIVSFCTKVFSASGGYIATFMLSAGNYDPLVEVQSLYAMNWIRFGMSLILVLGAVVVFVMNYRLKELTRDKLESYRSEIKAYKWREA